MRRLGLFSLAFVCGWILMGFEILGGRILSPFFGSDIHVWGSVIGVFLLALSVGYYLGGRLSTRLPHIWGLAGVIAVAGILIAVLPLYYVALGDVLFDRWVAPYPGSERWASLACALILFFAPSVALGMVSPYTIRLLATDLGRIGQQAGTLYAVSTAGSFIGAIFTSFYLILWLGSKACLFLHGGILVVSSLLAVLMWHLTKPVPHHGV